MFVFVKFRRQGDLGDDNSYSHNVPQIYGFIILIFILYKVESKNFFSVEVRSLEISHQKYTIRNSSTYIIQSISTHKMYKSLLD